MNDRGQSMPHTTHQVVLPFYVYAAIAFMASTIMLLITYPSFTQHYFHPHTLALTHSMALGWGTMIILGASHQLVPVLIESGLYSSRMAFVSFILAAVGIPMLVYGFYIFHIGWPLRVGGILVNAAILMYVINLGYSISRSKKENVQAVFIFTASCWLLATTLAGLLLVYNFSYPLLSKDSLSYLPLHAHLGIVGWFLLMVIGVGSRLIPMFLISKYENRNWLWIIYALINLALAGFVIAFVFSRIQWIYMIFILMIAAALVMFVAFCFQSYRQRIRTRVDNPVRLSLVSVLMIALPVFVLLPVLLPGISAEDHRRLVLVYGFTIFFGWLTAIILGMTFKTLPFIIWNKVYHGKSLAGKVPDPRELFDGRVVHLMIVIYLVGFILFATGILFECIPLLKFAAVLLLVAAVAYNFNVGKLVRHKPQRE